MASFNERTWGLSRARVAACAVIALVGTASGQFRTPTLLPTQRVITNLEARAKESPSATAYLNLARAHAYAFSMGTGQIPVEDEVGTAPNELGAKPSRAVGKLPPIGAKLSREQALVHLRSGIQAFNEAIKRDRRNTVAVYGLACLLEVGESMAGEVGVMPMVDVLPVSQDNAQRAESVVARLASRDATGSELGSDITIQRWGRNREYARALAWALVRARPKAEGIHLERINRVMATLWRQEMTELMFEAFCLGLPGDSTAIEQGLLGLDNFASYQAAKDYVRLTNNAADLPIRYNTINAAIRSFEKLPPCQAITPIVVPLESAGHIDSIADVLAPEARVTFDLDATGRGQTWSWVTPRAGLLCWDPLQAGKVTSGLQLFGSATWWLMFEDGYAAMDALDDNRDGALTGDELEGLSLWVDANTDGVSDPGEVRPLARFNITRLATRADKDASDGGSLVCSSGVTYSSGRVSPTFDWVTRPIAKLQHDHASQPNPAMSGVYLDKD